jgi:hypothetical protein
MNLMNAIKITITITYLIFGKTGGLIQIISVKKDIIRIRVAMWKETKLIEFCEFNNFETLNGKFGSDIRGEFTFINKQSSSIIDYTLASEGILRHIVDFKIGVEVISTHMPLLTELDNTIQGKVIKSIGLITQNLRT